MLLREFPKKMDGLQGNTDFLYVAFGGAGVHGTLQGTADAQELVTPLSPTCKKKLYIISLSECERSHPTIVFRTVVNSLREIYI